MAYPLPRLASYSSVSEDPGGAYTDDIISSCMRVCLADMSLRL
eukprot:CAMPEP_0197546678 /NCGR_PEP_ID=MMETSP1320-20131121/1207_1 /TAXON_ID=91990 /ORGANISM="Bolidomonas sp., Strain RCC2347" /LENGTH=42 /DNA_ID= /DNA_START= /DNA_END= /DNA_ORIENTATION=